MSDENGEVDTTSEVDESADSTPEEEKSAVTVPEAEELETVVSAYLVSKVTASVGMVPEGETVSFRFGGDPGSRVDLIVEYEQLDRMRGLVDDAIRIRDSDDPPVCRPVLDGL